MPDQNLPPVDMSTFKPLGSTEPTAAPEAGNSLPPVDMSTFKPLGGVPDTKTPPQAGMVDRFAQGFGSAAASTLTGLGKIASVVPGIPQVANAVGDVMGLPKLDSTTNPYDTVAQGIKPAQQQAQSTIAGKAGGMLENIAEFMTGEEGLKGLSEVERLRKLMPVMKMFEESPRLLKAAQVAMTAAQTGMVMGGQELAHGGTAKQAAEQAGVGAGLGVAGSAIFSAGKFGYNALKAAGWSGAALDAVTKIASENVRPAEEVADSLSHQITNAEAVMHTSFDNAMESIRGKVGDVKVPLSGSPLHEAAVNLQTDMAKLPQGIQTGIKGLVPAEGNMSGLIEGLTDGKTTTLTGSQLIDLRQQLSKQLTRVSPAIKEGIGKILDGIDDTLDHVAGEAGHVEGVSDEYSSARAAYRQTLADLKEPFIQRIQNGKISDALDMLGKGQEAPHRMDVLKRLIGQDSVAGLGLNKFADVIKAATDEDGRLSIQKAVAGWEKLSDQTRKSMFEATPEVGARLEQLMDGLRTMGKVQTYAKVGAGLMAMGLSAAALSSGFKGTVSAIETVGAVAMLAGFGKFGGGQELIEKLATNKTLLEGLGKMYGYTGENVVQRLGQVGTQTAEQLAKQGAEGPAPATAWDAVMNAAKNISTGSEEGAVGNVRKRVAGEPGTSSLIGKRGVAAAKTAANQADDVAAVLSKKGAKGAKEAEPTATSTYKDLGNGTHEVKTTDANGEPNGYLLARDTNVPGESQVKSHWVGMDSRGQDIGSNQIEQLAKSLSEDPSRRTLLSDDEMTGGAVGAWRKLRAKYPDAISEYEGAKGDPRFRLDLQNMVRDPKAAEAGAGGINHETAAAAHNENGGSTFHPTQGDMNGKPAFSDLASVGAGTPADQAAAIPQAERDALSDKEIGTRKPWAKSAVRANDPNATGGRDAIAAADAASPAKVEHIPWDDPRRMDKSFRGKLGAKENMAATLVDYAKRGIFGGFEFTPEDLSSADGVINASINHFSNQLVELYNRVPSAIRDVSRLWYESAHATTKQWAKEYGISHEQMAGVIAMLSPKNAWDNNVGVARRLIETWKNSRHLPWDGQMDEALSRIRDVQVKAIAKAQKAGKAGDPAFLNMLDDIRGKKYGELAVPTEGLTAEEAHSALREKQALWIRMMDEAHGSKSTDLYAPDGTVRGKTTRAWGMNGPAAKALDILEGNKDVSGIDDIIGDGHKIRNFYNNIINPWSKRGHTTIDTHAVSAAWWNPWSSNDGVVNHNFGGGGGKGAVNPSSVAETGTQGLYDVYEAAYRQAAQKIGVQPRELQSMTWEGIRALMGGDKKTAQLRSVITDIWKQHAEGRLTQAQAYDKVIEASGGFTKPDWLTQADWDAETSADKAETVLARRKAPPMPSQPVVQRAK